ncbi:hypothetical protein [Novosphingobium sp. FSW06-99]|uniref:hypothetical protein n=1 Tax=Novosphingobium sp. FSW06-99 TaxID=1739113 RepID=UPI0012E39AAB|nr:hypothetical protein [Novosphingobium sp. FSW06-99]
MAIPSDGIRVCAGQLTRNDKKTVVRFIRITIGAKLARSISLTQPEQRLRLAFGTDADAGKVQVTADNEIGKFRAARDKAGNYGFTINAATADGLFSLEFPEFAVAAISFSPGAGGNSLPRFVFNASAEMLDLKD